MILNRPATPEEQRRVLHLHDPASPSCSAEVKNTASLWQTANAGARAGRGGIGQAGHKTGLPAALVYEGLVSTLQGVEKEWQGLHADYLADAALYQVRAHHVCRKAVYKHQCQAAGQEHGRNGDVQKGTVTASVQVTVTKAASTASRSGGMPQKHCCESSANASC